jgi:CheY-like chemotaxis protein
MTYGYHFPISSIEEALQSTPESEGGRRPVLLIVDDEELIVETLSAILSRANFTVLGACDGASALEIAKVIPPDLLISDVAMPGMNGIELAVSLVCMVPDCRVLLFSGHAQPRDLEDARKAGFNFPLLAKPVHPRTMLDNVHICLRAALPMIPTLAEEARLPLAS